MKSFLITTSPTFSQLTLPELPVQEFDRTVAVKQCIEDHWDKKPGKISKQFLAAVMNALGIQSSLRNALGTVVQPDGKHPDYYLYLYCGCPSPERCGKVDFRFEHSKVTVTYAEGYK